MLHEGTRSALFQQVVLCVLCAFDDWEAAGYLVSPARPLSPLFVLPQLLHKRAHMQPLCACMGNRKWIAGLTGLFLKIHLVLDQLLLSCLDESQVACSILR